MEHAIMEVVGIQLYTLHPATWSGCVCARAFLFIPTRSPLSALSPGCPECPICPEVSERVRGHMSGVSEGVRGHVSEVSEDICPVCPVLDAYGCPKCPKVSEGVRRPQGSALAHLCYISLT